MVILSLALDEAIHIGDKVVVRLCKVAHDRVVLGIEAPNDTPVQKAEVAAAIRRASLGVSAEPGDG